MGVRARLLLLVLIAALPVFLLTAWSEIERRGQLQQAAEDQLVRAVRLLAAQQDQFFQRAESVLLSMLIAVSENWQDTAHCNGFLSRLASRNPEYTGFGVATADGTIVCSSRPDMLGTSLAHREYFQETLEARAFDIGDVRTGPSSGQQIVGLALPLVAESGTIELVGISGLDLYGLSQTISSGAVASPAVAVVFNGKGSVLARSREPEQWVGRPVDHALLEAARSGSGGVAELGQVDGEPQIWATVPLLPQKGVHAAVGAPTSSLFEGAEDLFWRNGTLLFLVLLAAAIGAWLIGERMIRKPLRTLQAAVERLKAGEPGARSIDLGRTSELVQLAGSFETMSQALELHETYLEEKNAQLTQLAADREILLREMNHRVKNSLQLVSAMIGLQRGTVPDEDARAELARAQGRVAAVARVHERLYQSEQGEMVDAGRYLHDLCHDLAESTGVQATGGEIVCQAGACIMPADRVVPLGIITTELATNALKHAFPDGGGRIEVALEDDGETCRLLIADNGQGLPAGFERSKRTGLGMKVIDSLADQLGARTEVERLSPGTRITIEFPSTTAADG